MQIHVIRNGKRLGPFDEEQLTDALNSGAINYDDLAWTDGLADWMPLRKICTPPPGAPPPPPPTPPTQGVSGEKRDTYGLILIALPFIAIALMFLGLGDPTLLVWAVVVASAILIGVDAKNLRIGGPTDLNKKGKRINAPASRLKKSCRAVKSEFLSLR